MFATRSSTRSGARGGASRATRARGTVRGAVRETARYGIAPQSSLTSPVVADLMVSTSSDLAASSESPE